MTLRQERIRKRAHKELRKCNWAGYLRLERLAAEEHTIRDLDHAEA